MRPITYYMLESLVFNYFSLRKEESHDNLLPIKNFSWGKRWKPQEIKKPKESTTLSQGFR